MSGRAAGHGGSARRMLPGGYELDDDRSRIDARAVHRFLSEQSYWAAGCRLGDVEASIARAARAVGLYGPGGALVGFARVIEDGRPCPYLADVFVLFAHRGRGLGLELVRECVDNGPQAEQPWELRTQDAHTLYERFGFVRGDGTLMSRPARVQAG